MDFFWRSDSAGKCFALWGLAGEICLHAADNKGVTSKIVILDGFRGAVEAVNHMESGTGLHADLPLLNIIESWRV